MAQRKIDPLVLAGLLTSEFGSQGDQQGFAQIIASILGDRRDESQDTRRLAEENARLNTSLGLDPGTAQAGRAKFIGQQQRTTALTAGNEQAAGLEGGIPALRQRLQTLPPGHPLRVGIESRLASMGADLQQPVAPPGVEALPRGSGPPVRADQRQKVEGTGLGGSVQPVGQFKQLKDIARRTELQTASQDAQAGRAGPAEVAGIRRAEKEVDAEFATDSAGKPTEKQVTAGLVSSSGIRANKNAAEIESTISGRFQTFGGPFGEQSQIYQNAKDAYFELIRTLTGAAANEAEEGRQERRFFVKFLDTPGTVKVKQFDRTQHLIDQIVISGQVAESLGISVDDVILSMGNTEGGLGALTDEQKLRFKELKDSGEGEGAAVEGAASSMSTEELERLEATLLEAQGKG